MNQRQALEMAQEVMRSWQGQAPVGFNEAFQAVNQALEQPVAWAELTPEQVRACFFVGEPPATSPPHWWEYRNPDYMAIYSNIAAKLREKNGGA
jgi:hypothetical protein